MTRTAASRSAHCCLALLTPASPSSLLPRSAHSCLTLLTPASRSSLLPRTAALHSTLLPRSAYSCLALLTPASHCCLALLTPASHCCLALFTPASHCLLLPRTAYSCLALLPRSAYCCLTSPPSVSSVIRIVFRTMLSGSGSSSWTPDWNRLIISICPALCSSPRMVILKGIASPGGKMCAAELGPASSRLGGRPCCCDLRNSLRVN